MWPYFEQYYTDNSIYLMTSAQFAQSKIRTLTEIQSRCTPKIKGLFKVTKKEISSAIHLQENKDSFNHPPYFSANVSTFSTIYLYLISRIKPICERKTKCTSNSILHSVRKEPVASSHHNRSNLIRICKIHYMHLVKYGGLVFENNFGQLYFSMSHYSKKHFKMPMVDA